MDLFEVVLLIVQCFFKSVRRILVAVLRIFQTIKSTFYLECILPRMLFFDAEYERRLRLQRNKMHVRICQTRLATECRDEGIRVMSRICTIQDEIERDYLICRASIEGFCLLVKQCYNKFVNNEVMFSTAFHLILTVNELMINIEASFNLKMIKILFLDQIAQSVQVLSPAPNI